MQSQVRRDEKVGLINDKEANKLEGYLGNHSL